MRSAASARTTAPTSCAISQSITRSMCGSARSFDSAASTLSAWSSRAPRPMAIRAARPRSPGERTDDQDFHRFRLPRSPELVSGLPVMGLHVMAGLATTLRDNHDCARSPLTISTVIVTPKPRFIHHAPPRRGNDKAGVDRRSVDRLPQFPVEFDDGAAAKLKQLADLHRGLADHAR